MKKSLISVVFLLFLVNIFALPGITPNIEDLPGQYVYYCDTTFERESYTGFLMFDKNTYAARYYAPENKKTKQKSIDVEIFFTLEGNADHVNLTGEKIIRGFSMEDTEFINYLHDMIYELNSRRAKTSEINAKYKNYIKSDYFPQFGGRVAIEYDILIPLFNVKSIFQEESKPEFYIVTTGQISGTNDKSFEQFKGFPQKYDDNRHSMPKAAKANPITVKSPEGQTAQLDSNWTSAMENLWMLGNAASVSMSSLPDAKEDFVLRQLLLTNGTNYLNWKDISYSLKDGKIFINGIFYDPNTKTVSRNFKIAQKSANGYDFFTLTVYNNVYLKNRKYFTSIVESYLSER